MTEHAEHPSTSDTIRAKLIFDDARTEDVITQRLVEMGVPPKKIVLGFHSAFKRQCTEYVME